MIEYFRKPWINIVFINNYLYFEYLIKQQRIYTQPGENLVI
jgi:hypothetical protein